MLKLVIIAQICFGGGCYTERFPFDAPYTQENCETAARDVEAAAKAFGASDLSMVCDKEYWI